MFFCHQCLFSQERGNRDGQSSWHLPSVSGIAVRVPQEPSKGEVWHAGVLCPPSNQRLMSPIGSGRNIITAHAPAASPGAYNTHSGGREVQSIMWGVKRWPMVVGHHRVQPTPAMGRCKQTSRSSGEATGRAGVWKEPEPSGVHAATSRV